MVHLDRSRGPVLRTGVSSSSRRMLRPVRHGAGIAARTRSHAVDVSRPRPARCRSRASRSGFRRRRLLMSQRQRSLFDVFGLYVVSGSALAACRVYPRHVGRQDADEGGPPPALDGGLSPGSRSPRSGLTTAFCQFMLCWIADIPARLRVLHLRLYSDWSTSAGFAVPVLTRRSPS